MKPQLLLCQGFTRAATQAQQHACTITKAAPLPIPHPPGSMIAIHPNHTNHSPCKRVEGRLYASLASVLGSTINQACSSTRNSSTPRWDWMHHMHAPASRLHWPCSMTSSTYHRPCSIIPSTCRTSRSAALCSALCRHAHV